MSSARNTLTPHMAQYDDFVDRGHTRWLPYLMYYHRAGYRSAVVNTDRLGFRYSHGVDGWATVTEPAGPGPVNLLVGSSTAFGVGAGADARTIPSRLWSAYAPTLPWLNFGGRGYNSTQEALLFLLHRHLIPPVRDIVILSGLNNLALAGLPRHLQTDYGTFFFSGEFQAQMEQLRERHRQGDRADLVKRWRRRRPQAPTRDERTPDLDERLATAVRWTGQDLDHWKMFAEQSGARVSFVLQPLATWVRDTPSTQEAALFDELDQRSSTFWRLFSAIAPAQVGRRYAEELSAMAAKSGVTFVDLNQSLAKAASPGRWLFVDRAHFHDEGYDLVSRLIAAELDLS